MPTLFARLTKRSMRSSSVDQSRTQRSQNGVKPQNYPPSPVMQLVHVDQRIHPDLNSLVEDIVPIRKSSDTLTCPSGFAPLHPSPRRYTPSINVQMSNTAGDGTDVFRATSPGASVTSAFGLVDISQQSDDVSRLSMKEREFAPLVGLGQGPSPKATIVRINTGEEWPTFGRTRKGPGEFGELVNTGSVTPVTPVSASESEKSRTRNDTSTSTLGSRSRSSIHGRDHYTSASSPHTFGIPTPPSSVFTSGPRYRFRSSETPPPLPPLDHPAFSAGFTTRYVDITEAKSNLPTSLSREHKTRRQQRRPRHAASLPSFPHRSWKSTASDSSPKRNRQRARTQSGTRVTGIFSEPNQSSTVRNHRRHAKSQSRGGNGRRFSAELSALQASSVNYDYGSELAGSWEAQVTREMLRISLGRRREFPDFKIVTDSTELGPTRGNSLVRNNSLGSPFLLHYGHTHNLPGIIPDDHTRIGSNSVVTETSKDSSKIVMTKIGSSKVSEVTRDPVTSTSRRVESSTPERTPSPPLSRLNTIPYPGPTAPSTSFLMPPSLSFTAPTPEASPISPVRTEQHQKLPTDPLVSVLRVPSTPPVARTASNSSHKGKRKADEAGVGGGATPPKEHKEPRATFAVGPRPHRESATSGSSRAPSSYQRKRARLSATPESRPASRTSGDNQNAATTGSWSSRGSSYPAPPHRLPPAIHQEQLHRTPSRRSLSQTSIPISALISPHAPSISRSGTFHMRDPRKPAPVQSTSWSLAFPSSGDGPWVERGGSPLHAWLFFIGFVIFPIWWVAAFVGIPRTRRLGGTDAEKSVLLDDPQVEYDAKSWRNRCRVMAAVSFLTYVPFVVLVAVFAR